MNLNYFLQLSMVLAMNQIVRHFVTKINLHEANTSGSHLFSVVCPYFVSKSLTVFVLLDSAQLISVGWGRKETQFHGSEGKSAAAKKEEVSKDRQLWFGN